MEQIDVMKNGDFTDVEIELALHCLESALLGLYDSRSTVENFLLRRNLAGVNTDPTAYLSALRAVTRKEIIAAANRLSLDTVFYLKPDPKQSSENGGEEDDDNDNT